MGGGPGGPNLGDKKGVWGGGGFLDGQAPSAQSHSQAEAEQIRAQYEHKLTTIEEKRVEWVYFCRKKLGKVNHSWPWPHFVEKVGRSKG